MKYLKKFNESNELDYEDIISDLKDILLEINDIDDEFSNEIWVRNSIGFVPGERFPRSRKSIFIKIKRNLPWSWREVNRTLFVSNEREFEIVKDVINRIEEYGELNDMIIGTDSDINTKKEKKNINNYSMDHFNNYYHSGITIILFPIN